MNMIPPFRYGRMGQGKKIIFEIGSTINNRGHCSKGVPLGREGVIALLSEVEGRRDDETILKRATPRNAFLFFSCSQTPVWEQK